MHVRNGDLPYISGISRNSQTLKASQDSRQACKMAGRGTSLKYFWGSVFQLQITSMTRSSCSLRFHIFNLNSGGRFGKRLNSWRPCDRVISSLNAAGCEPLETVGKSIDEFDFDPRHSTRDWKVYITSEYRKRKNSSRGGTCIVLFIFRFCYTESLGLTICEGELTESSELTVGATLGCLIL
jgi:hypothetical protein